MLWHDTNYLGKYVKGVIIERQSLNKYPVALRCVPCLTLDFGDPAKIPRHKVNRIPLKEHHFLSQKPHDIIWDLYFLYVQPNALVRLVLVPRNVLDSPTNGITLHAEALYRLKWQYMGTLESSTFRWDLHLVLRAFFATQYYPHCQIEAFLPCLANPRSRRDGKNERVKENCLIDKVENTETSCSIEGSPVSACSKELESNLPQPSATVKSIPNESKPCKKLQHNRELYSDPSHTSTIPQSVPKLKKSSETGQQNRHVESGKKNDENPIPVYAKEEKIRKKSRGRAKKKMTLLGNSSNA